MDPTARFIVSGRVQGVGFRASTRDQAAAIGLRGHVRNLDDGTVEVIASGPSDALHRLERWLGRGPPSARVELVLRTDIEGARLAECFEIR